MLLDRAQLLAVEIVNPNELRQNLCGVWLEPDGTTVATDGHMLARVAPDPEAPEDQDFPQAPGVGAGGSLPAPILLSTDGVRKLLKSFQKLKTILPILRYVHLNVPATMVSKTHHAQFVVTDLDTQNNVAVRLVDDVEIPAYSNCIPKPEVAKVRIGLDAKKIAALAKVSKEAGGGDVIVLEIEDETHAVRVTSGNGRKRFTGILMPVRVSE